MCTESERSVDHPSVQTPELRVALVVESIHHNNTRKIAEAIAEVLNAEIISLDGVSVSGLREYDFIGFGSGIYYGRHHASLQKLARSLESIPQQTFLFSTAGLPCFQRFFHWPMRRILKARGCHLLGEFSCRGWDSFGPLRLFGGINRQHPDQHDLQRAKYFAQELIRRFARFQ